MVNIYQYARPIVNGVLSTGGTIPHARNVAQELLEAHPVEVMEWVTENTETILTQALASWLKDQRRELYKTAQAHRILEGTADDVYDIAAIWIKPFFVPDVGYKGLGELTGADHSAIGRSRHIQATTHYALSRLHTEMSYKVGLDKTKNVYTPEKVIELFGAAYDTEPLLERSAL